MKIIIFILAMLAVLPAYAIKIERYVSIGASGDGLSAESPTSDLAAVLSLAPKVDGLTVYITPGIYDGPQSDFETGTALPNVTILGVNDLNEKQNTNLRPTIQTSSLVLNNATLVNIEVYGGLQLYGSANIYNVNVHGIIHHVIGDFAQYQYIDCKGMVLLASGSDKQAYLSNVTSQDSRQYGLKAERVNIYAVGCEFFNNKVGGARVEAGKSSNFINCSFLGNEGEGACVIQEFGNYTTLFQNCEFGYNSTNTPYYYGGGVTSLASTLTFYNCIFSKNYCEKSQVAGAIKTGVNFMAYNCWFDNNDAAINCTASAGETNNGRIPVVNCVFTGNGKELYAPNGYQIETTNCAMQQGSGVPEIDAQSGNIAIHPDLDGSIEGVKYAGIYKTEAGNWALRENSVLINSGCPVNFVADFYGANRCMYGRTDIGPFEYSGTISPDTPAKEFFVGPFMTQACSAKFKGEEYGFLSFGSSTHETAGFSDLYCGKKVNDYKVFDSIVAVFVEEYGDKYCYLYTPAENYRGYSSWKFLRAFPYSGTKPVIKKIPGETLKLSVTINGKTEFVTL